MAEPATAPAQEEPSEAAREDAESIKAAAEDWAALLTVPPALPPPPRVLSVQSHVRAFLYLLYPTS